MAKKNKEKNTTGIVKVVKLPISPRGGCGSACTTNNNVNV